jgi:hypothetical protein
MRLLTLLLLISPLVLAGCSRQALSTPLAATEQPALYPDLGEVPDLGNETWINILSPLRLEGLRGKSLLVYPIPDR